MLSLEEFQKSGPIRKDSQDGRKQALRDSHGWIFGSVGRMIVITLEMPQGKHRKMCAQSWDRVFQSDAIISDVFFHNSTFFKNNTIVQQ